MTKWFLKVSIYINSNNQGKIPDNSIWYIIIDDHYPEGSVKIYPNSNSFDITFKHQSNNGKIANNNLWRTGSLCLDSPLKCLGKYDFYSEPMDAKNRLLWNVKRAIDWIHAANDDNLTNEEDPFELPEFEVNNSINCVFSENTQSYIDWKSLEKKFGIAKLDTYNSEPSIYFIKEFHDLNNKIIKGVKWGTYLSQISRKSKSKKQTKQITALWVLLEEIPVVNEWQAPNYYGELFNACKKQNIDLKDIIKNLSSNIRDGSKHILFIGFPIPHTIGGENSIIHWQAIKLPLFSEIKGRISRTHQAKGRRKNKNASLNSRGIRSVNENAAWNLDRKKFNSDNEIEWLKSQNWDIQEITNRGRLDKLSSLKTLIIGAGTIGTTIAELLARSGITKISIMDDDKLEIGNLSRHPLGLMHIGKYKSEEMEVYLNHMNPHVKAEGINNKFKCFDEIIAKMNEYDLIIECTGEDYVLKKLEKIKFEKNKLFVSVSIGVDAKRLYLSLQNRKKFKLDNFREKIAYWTEKEKAEISNYNLPRDGIGCWSAIFPARYDDIYLASSTTIKVIENFIYNGKIELNAVYQQHSKNEIFIGYIKVE